MSGSTITRADLSEAVYEEVGLSRNESAELVEAVLDEISDALVDGDTVKISSFGSFSVRQKGERVGRNPKTGEEGSDPAAAGVGVPRVACAEAQDQPGRRRLTLPDRTTSGSESLDRVTRDRPTRFRAQRARQRTAGGPGRRSWQRAGPAGSRPMPFRTISEVSDELEVPQHVLRFWESKFGQVKPLKRGGGRRYYRPNDIELLRRIRDLLYREGLHHQGGAEAAAREQERACLGAGRRPEGDRSRSRRPPRADGPAQGAGQSAGFSCALPPRVRAGSPWADALGRSRLRRDSTPNSMSGAAAADIVSACVVSPPARPFI